MIGARYVLHLRGDRGGRVVRYASPRRLATGDVVDLAAAGAWRVTNVVSADSLDVTAAIAYCEATADGASVQGRSRETS